MLRESLLKCFIISFSSMFIVTALAFAERVKPLNPDCETCPLVISYDGDEARNLLGKDGMSQIMKLEKIEKKRRKIDLDGLKVIGTEKDSDEGYELLVIVYKHLIVINSLQDGSSIKIRTDFSEPELHRDMNQWNPEIQLLLSGVNEIKETDNLALAWEKMKDSCIYGHVNNSIDHRKWNKNFRAFVLNVLEAVIDS